MPTTPCFATVWLAPFAVGAAALGACGYTPWVGASDAGQDGAQGAVEVVGTASDCPSVTGLGISPAELDLGTGGAATLTAFASLPGSAQPTYAWTAPSGVFGDASAPTTTFECTAAGDVSLSLTVSFGGCSAAVAGTLACVDRDAGPSD